MPNRIVREGINSSARVDRLSDGAELFYRRLISVVDDYGRYYASPATLRGACWPIRPERVTDASVAGWVAECVSVGLIATYQADGSRFLQMLDFRQQVRSKSKFPEPASNCAADAQQVISTRRSAEAEAESYTEAETVCVAENAALARKPAPVLTPFPPLPPAVRDWEARYQKLYDKHVLPGFHADGRREYLELISSAVHPETVAESIDVSHAEWMAHFVDNPQDYRPGIGKWFHDRYYTRHPREPPRVRTKREKNREEWSQA